MREYMEHSGKLKKNAFAKYVSKKYCSFTGEIAKMFYMSFGLVQKEEDEFSINTKVARGKDEKNFGHEEGYDAEYEDEDVGVGIGSDGRDDREDEEFYKEQKKYDSDDDEDDESDEKFDSVYDPNKDDNCLDEEGKMIPNTDTVENENVYEKAEEIVLGVRDGNGGKQSFNLGFKSN
jgi:hypothetical protein